MFERNTFVHSDRNGVSFTLQNKNISCNNSASPISDLHWCHNILRDFPWIYRNLFLFKGKKLKFSMFEHNTSVHSNVRV